jgi:hypothetical protein
MNKITSSDENPRETRALARFAAVQAVVQARQNGSTLTQALHHAAQQPWDGRYYSPATIEDWVYRYQHGQFAALQNQPRRDRGQHRALDPAALEALCKLRREYPLLTVKALTGIRSPPGVRSEHATCRSCSFARIRATGSSW